MGWSRDLSCHCGRSLPKPQLKLEIAPPPHPPPHQPASLELQMEDHQLEQELLEQELRRKPLWNAETIGEGLPTCWHAVLHGRRNM